MYERGAGDYSCSGGKVARLEVGKKYPIRDVCGILCLSPEEARLLMGGDEIDGRSLGDKIQQKGWVSSEGAAKKLGLKPNEFNEKAPQSIHCVLVCDDWSSYMLVREKDLANFRL